MKNITSCNVLTKCAGRGGRVDSVFTYYAGGFPIESRQPTSATYIACRERDWLPCWPSRGVIPEVNLRNSLHAGSKACKWGMHPGFETQGRHHQKSNTGVSVAPQKELMSSKNFKKQESPPVWTQEAYHPPCSKYSLCCSTWVPPQAGYPPILTWLGGTYLGTPWQGTPPSWTWQGPPRLDLAGYPPGWTWQGTPPGWTWQGTPLGVCPMAFWEMLQSIMGYGYPPECEQTNKVKLLPSRRTTYAGGKNVMSWLVPKNHFIAVGVQPQWTLFPLMTRKGCG